LAVGQYHTQLVVTGEAGVAGSPQTIPVTLIVADELSGVYLLLFRRVPQAEIRPGALGCGLGWQ